MKNNFPAPPWIGTDESGKGDYFGPLVVAAVYADSESAKLLEALGVRDSKLLSDHKAIALAGSIAQVCRGSVVVVELKPQTYNDLYEKFVLEKKNLNALLAWAHARAIEDLHKTKNCPTVIADQFGDENYLKSRLLNFTRENRTVLIQRPRAEENVAVAAASIVARSRLLQWHQSAAASWGSPFPKGSTHVVEAARMFIQKHGRQKLNQVAKLHFRITKSLDGSL